MNALRTAVAALALVLLAPGPATAQSKPRAEEARKAPAKKGEDPKGEPGKVLRLEEVEVQGKVQRPAVLSITPPAAAMAGESGHDESFIPKIVEAADKEPF
jgi:flagellum-specific peptidoglycan hydrolase FlgJ